MSRGLLKNIGLAFVVVGISLCLQPNHAHAWRFPFKYSKALIAIESQPLDPSKAVVMYWDQSATDALGIKLPPGRVGLKNYDDAILKKFGFEIKQGAKTYLATLKTTHNGQPLLFIEDDALNGAGRAGYFEVEPGVFVNSKGIGITGEGLTKGTAPTPPSDHYITHGDGGAAAEEGGRETVYGLTADNELSVGGDRVLGIIFTGRFRVGESGESEPLVLVVRAPLRRHDQEREWMNSKRFKIKKESQDKAMASLGEANAKRLLKGDFKNSSNLGAEGEFVDYGVITFTGGYAPLHSSVDVQLLREGIHLDRLYNQKTDEMQVSFATHLLMQTGIPEAHVNTLDPTLKGTRAKLNDLYEQFERAVYYSPTQERADSVRVPLEKVDPPKLLGDTLFHEFFKSVAARFFRAQPSERSGLLEAELKRLDQLSKVHIPEVQEIRRQFVSRLYDLYSDIESKTEIADRNHYADSLEKIASFKNRDIPELGRPELYHRFRIAEKKFVQDKDGAAFGNEISNLVLSSRFETTSVSEPNITMRETPKNTEYYIRSFVDAGGAIKIFSHPDLNGASRGQKFEFRLSNDHGRTSHDFPATFVAGSMGEYLKIEVPHGALPFSSEKVELVPMLQSGSEQPQPLSDGFKISAPPLVTNESLGLPPSFERKPGVMRKRFNIRMSPQPEDFSDMVPVSSEARYSRTVRCLMNNVKLFLPESP